MFLFQTLNIFHTFFLRYTIFGFEQANVSWEEIFPIAKLSRFLALMKHHPYAKKQNGLMNNTPNPFPNL